jgi:anti-sigma B factor antagonist
MALWIDKHSIGDVTLLKCSGRIVEGDAAQTLTEHVTETLAEYPFVVLDLSQIEFLDSSGLGLLVRLLNRTRASSGDLKLCAVSAKVNAVLQATRLASVFDMFATADQAIASFGRRSAVVAYPIGAPEILCVDRSADVLAYLRELLKHAGYQAITANNIPDALMLLRATQPKVVVVGSGVRSQPATSAMDTFNSMAAARAVVELPANFSFDDASEVGRRLVEQIKAMIAV